ncbi:MULTISPECIES: Fur family transcriptional regulator [Cupriavidus]
MRTAPSGASTPASLETAARRIAGCGLSATVARISLLMLMEDSPVRHRSVEAWCAVMLDSRFRSAISTFRNAIYEFAEHGLLYRVSVRPTHKLVEHLYEVANVPPHQHLYCLQCHRIEEVFDHALQAAHRQRLHAHGLEPAAVLDALHGVCGACQAMRATA